MYHKTENLNNKTSAQRIDMTDIEFQGDARRFFEAVDSESQKQAQEVLSSLSSGFLVSRFEGLGEKVWYALLKPRKWVQERFGLSQEYVVVGNCFDFDFQVKTLQMINETDLDHRVDKQLQFVASSASNVKHVCSGWARRNGVSIIVMDEAAACGDQTDLSRMLSDSLWVRDRFDDSEPVRTPGEFFGREALVNDCVNRLRTGKTVALMGVRKIGKSSVLRRVEDRLITPNDNYVSVSAFVNCNGSDIKSSHWSFLALKLIDLWTESISQKAKLNERKIDLKKVKSLRSLISDRKSFRDHGALTRAFSSDFYKLRKATAALGAGKVVQMIAFFDEVDHLNPLHEDKSWQTGYFHFWNSIQALKRELSDNSELVWMMGGVNPQILYSGSLLNEPNPLFETPRLFLKPMNLDESLELMQGLGSPMGLGFDLGAVKEAFRFTAGHPWLLRKVGSFIHNKYSDRQDFKEINASAMSVSLKRNKASFYNYIEWVLTHLKNIASDEYYMLQDLCVQGVRSYEEDWSESEFREVFAQHLEDYGLIEFDDELPVVKFPLIIDVFTKSSTATFSTKLRRLKDCVDGLEKSIRRRLINDIMYPNMEEDQLHESYREEPFAVKIIADSLPRNSGGRAKTRDQLIELGLRIGIEAMFEALNWNDYIILFEKFFDSMRLNGIVGSKDEFVGLFKETVRFVHVIRHNNTTAIEQEIKERGFDGCMEILMNAQGFVSD